MPREESPAITITIVEGEQPGRSFECREGVISLGRDSGNTIRLEDKFVSARHGQITVQEGRCSYRDLESRNGSVIARGQHQWHLGRDSSQLERPLEEGDRIVLGETVLEVAIGPAQVVLASSELSRLRDTAEALQTERGALLALYGMERQIHLELDPAKLGKSVLKAALDAFRAAASAAIVSVDPGSLEITGVTSAVSPGRKEARVSRSMARRVLEEKRAICFQDARRTFPDSDSVIAGGLQCAMCAPLWTGNQMRGVLQVSSTDAPKCFSDRDLDLLTVFANRAAIALANAELNEERQRAANFRELTDYLANELRCAATGLFEWLKPLEDGDFGPIQDLQLEAVRTARLGAQMVGTLVTSMTDLAQFRQPGLILEIGPVDLHEVADVPFKLASAKAQLEGLEVLSNLSPGLPPVAADRQLLQRVMLNALFFAIVWADASAPVRLAFEADAAGPMLSVEWQGEPVPEADRESIFDPETQARLWKDLGRRSAGVGLAFCKLAVEMMRGQIRLDATESRNALRVSLPLASDRP